MDPPAPEPTPTFERLMRRKVVQWSLAYAAGAWALVQVIEFAVGTFQWPEPLVRGAAAAAVAGLPVVITLAWYHGDRGRPRVTRGELAVLAVFVAIGVAAVIRVAHLPASTRPAASAASDQASRASAPYDTHRIAILPFDNLGGEAANAAFVGGVHDTLITIVGKIPGLAVIAKGSVLQFAGKHPTIASVARSLRAGSVLEGSVAREGRRLRIQAQLVDANTDANLWAETYDREADDLFDVQRDIAEAVAEQLRIRLSTTDARELARALTKVPAAYEHYTVGRSVANDQDWPAAVREFAQAIALDPSFAAAHAQLGLAYVWVGFFDPSRRAEDLPQAKAAIDKALELDPTLPEGHLALAIYYYRGVQDIERASAEFERAITGLPNDADAHKYFAFLRRWQGRWEEATALLGRAAELDPRNEVVKTYALALVTLGKRAEAAKVIDAGAVARPDDVELALWPGDLAANFSCDLRRQEAVLAKVAARFPDSPELLFATWQFALQVGDLQRARLALAKMGPHPFDAADDDHAFRLGVMALWLGEREEAQRQLRTSAQVHQRRAVGYAAGSDSAALEFAQIALDLALLGDRKGSIENARRVMKLTPKNGTGTNNLDAYWLAAAALARVGDARGALDVLELLFSHPTLYKPALAWCDPMLQPLRKDPRYREFIASRGVDLSIDPLRRETWPREGIGR
jgi:TolB-like protein/Tfp pilus assembly protein PilF